MNHWALSGMALVDNVSNISSGKSCYPPTMFTQSIARCDDVIKWKYFLRAHYDVTVVDCYPPTLFTQSIWYSISQHAIFLVVSPNVIFTVRIREVQVHHILFQSSSGMSFVVYCCGNHHCLVLVHDITQRKWHQRLPKLNRFVYSISHWMFALFVWLL